MASFSQSVMILLEYSPIKKIEFLELKVLQCNNDNNNNNNNKCHEKLKMRTTSNLK